MKFFVFLIHRFHQISAMFCLQGNNIPLEYIKKKSSQTETILLTGEIKIRPDYILLDLSHWTEMKDTCTDQQYLSRNNNYSYWNSHQEWIYSENTCKSLSSSWHETFVWLKLMMFLSIYELKYKLCNFQINPHSVIRKISPLIINIPV